MCLTQIACYSRLSRALALIVRVAAIDNLEGSQARRQKIIIAARTPATVREIPDAIAAGFALPSDTALEGRMDAFSLALNPSATCRCSSLTLSASILGSCT